VTTLEGRSGSGRIVLLPRRSTPTRSFYKVAFPRVQAPPGFQPVYRNRSWKVLAAPACRAA
jgi:hypothetical protein